MKVLLNGSIIAESDEAILLDEYYYFPKKDVNMKNFSESNHRTECPWKGIANYFHVLVDSENFDNIAWCYPMCQIKAKSIEGYIAFLHPAVVEN
ncbi:MAG: DUF427 domain-containing protein [Kangiellaceae bacterium]|nr:DUF427 domain-containing protein [Kangiellaceae bacterium]